MRGIREAQLLQQLALRPPGSGSGSGSGAEQVLRRSYRVHSVLCALAIVCSFCLLRSIFFRSFGFLCALAVVCSFCLLRSLFFRSFVWFCWLVFGSVQLFCFICFDVG